MVEQGPVKATVAGSSPARGAILRSACHEQAQRVEWPHVVEHVGSYFQENYTTADITFLGREFWPSLINKP